MRSRHHAVRTCRRPAPGRTRCRRRVTGRTRCRRRAAIVRTAVLPVAFHRNGEPASLGTSRARDEIRAVFERSKLFSAVSDKSTDDADRFDIVLDNRGDVGDAMAKGMLTGITFGGAGSRVTDGYVFTVKFQRAGGEPLTKVYRHAIHSTIG